MKLGRTLRRELHLCGSFHKHQQRKLRSTPDGSNRRQALKPCKASRCKREGSLKY